MNTYRKILAAWATALLLAAPAAAYLPGIDVSHHQGSINWNSVKNAGIKYSFVKATEGVDFTDANFPTYFNGARAAGVPTGPYHFAHPESLNGVPFTSYNGLPFTPGSGPYNDAVSEANDFIDAIKPYYQTGQHLPPVADIERFPNFATISLERTFTSYWMNLFSDTVKNALGVRPIVYTGLSNGNTFFNTSVTTTHEHWLAWYRGTGSSVPPVPSDTPLWNPWLFWQWTDSGSVSGISGNVDLDLFDGTEDELAQLMIGRDASHAGDYNRDGIVDAADYTRWRDSLGQNVPICSGADGNCDAHVTSADYTLWQANFGQTGPAIGDAALATAALPEPAASTTILFSAMLAAIQTRRSRLSPNRSM